MTCITTAIEQQTHKSNENGNLDTSLENGRRYGNEPGFYQYNRRDSLVLDKLTSLKQEVADLRVELGEKDDLINNLNESLINAETISFLQKGD